MIDDQLSTPTLSAERAVHDRPLEPHELELLAREVAARPELWERHIDPDASQRTYAPLHRDEHVDVWAIFWLPENDTGWHDHDTSSGAVHVVSGELDESVLRVLGPEERRAHAAGDSFAFGPTHIHRVTCSRGRAVSIHAYSPPLWRLGVYAVDHEGFLTRTSVSYADELRPLDTGGLEDLPEAA